MFRTPPMLEFYASYRACRRPRYIAELVLYDHIAALQRTEFTACTWFQGSELKCSIFKLQDLAKWQRLEVCRFHLRVYICVFPAPWLSFRHTQDLAVTRKHVQRAPASKRNASTSTRSRRKFLKPCPFSPSNRLLRLASTQSPWDLKEV